MLAVVFETIDDKVYSIDPTQIAALNVWDDKEVYLQTKRGKFYDLKESFASINEKWLRALSENSRLLAEKEGK